MTEPAGPGTPDTPPRSDAGAPDGTPRSGAPESDHTDRVAPAADGTGRAEPPAPQRTEQSGAPGPAQPEPPEHKDETPGPLAPGEAVVPLGTVDLGLEPVTDTVAVRRGAFGVSGSGDTSGFGGLTRATAMPDATPKPFGGWFDELSEELELALADGNLPAESAIEKVVVDRGEITFFVRREHLVEVARTLRDEPGLRFEICHSVSGAHYLADTGRELHTVIHLLSITHKRRIRLEVVCPDADPHVPSVTSVWPGADWHERETWDMFGIRFDGHPALTRILMPDDWPGHPQRKDYPLGGIPVEYKGATTPPPDQRRSYN